MMHKVFISFKYKDLLYKNDISSLESIEFIDKSLTEKIDSEDPEYIMGKIRREHLRDSTVTLFLIGDISAEDSLREDQYYIKKELQASLTRYDGRPPNGILGVVLPSMYEKIYRGKHQCPSCGYQHNLIRIDDSTVIKEFSANYYIPNNKCSWGEDDRYCILVKWCDFMDDPQYYINQAYEKRLSKIEQKIRVRP